MKIYSAMNYQVTHLDVVQGSDEERKGNVQEVHRLSTVVSDAVMRQELSQSLSALPKGVA